MIETTYNGALVILVESWLGIKLERCRIRNRSLVLIGQKASLLWSSFRYREVFRVVQHELHSQIQLIFC